jgi:excisionase family DNA binding protein
MERQISSDDPLLTPNETVEYLRLPSTNTLYGWRYANRGPRSIKVGRHVRYRRSDLDAWLAAHTSDGDADLGPRSPP